jgi:hypothetical protein
MRIEQKTVRQPYNGIALIPAVLERYDGIMAGLLESAIRRVESLSREEQDAIASQSIETLDDEASWERSFRDRPEVLRALAQEALDEHRRRGHSAMSDPGANLHICTPARMQGCRWHHVPNVYEVRYWWTRGPVFKPTKVVQIWANRSVLRAVGYYPTGPRPKRFQGQI